MHILHIITRLIRGGAQLNTVLCCDAQVRAGHRVTLAYGPIYGPEGSLLDRARDSGAELVEINAMRRAVLPWHDVMAWRAIRKMVLRLEPDVVHTHSSKAGIVGRSAAWSARTKRSNQSGHARPAVVHTIHGLAFHDRQSRVVYRGYVAAERYAARRCDAMIGITQAMVDAFESEKIGKKSQFHVVPSGVELSQFRRPEVARNVLRDEFGLRRDAMVVGVVARLDPLKGQDDLLDVMPKLVQRVPNAQLWLVGDGYHRDALEQRIAAMGLQDRVTLAGLVSSEKIPQALAAMDVMALPSYQEGQGRVLVEALACGCPIVGYDAGGIGAVCVDEVTGYLAKVGDRDGLLHAIVRTIGMDESAKAAMREAGLQHVREQFSVETMTAGVMQVYESVCAG